MMKKLEKIKTWTIVIILIIAGAIALYQKYQYNKIIDSNQLMAVRISTLQDSTLTFVTKSGQLVSKMESIEIEKDNLKESLEIMGIDVKKLKKENIKLKNITSVLKLELEATGSITVNLIDTFEIIKTDTIKYQKFDEWSNTHLTLYGGTIKNSQLNIDKYKYLIGLKITPTKERKKTIVTVTLTDPKAIISSANSITLTHKKKWWEKQWIYGIAGFAAGVFITK